MNPPCGRCNKAVYPTEKINCLDKYWHKGCFSCEVCKMALSMTNYKGFDKKPYCTMHYPKSSFTIVTDTPENLRLKQQSMLNSQALYKEEFEKNKGKGFSAVADTPEMQRMKKTQDQISNALYKEDFEKNKGKGFSVVADTPEMQRLKKTQDQISNIKYHEEFEKSKVRSDAPPPENRQNYEQDEPELPDFGERRPAAPPPGGLRPPHPQTTALPDFGERRPAEPPFGGLRPPHPQVFPPQMRYQAMYSYTAAEADEVSLQEGDLILDVEPIDEGWVFGCNQRTGQKGMLPANYVRPV